ncbi:MAG: hypothetical protein AUI10_07100 [Actinobacteria bacterium 13_2_20CM_2_72_6]|nr:MAG: hypothetical protein AUI10_07100 [Actinobacteria bacterium 13_2_20CM_2_72_6]
MTKHSAGVLVVGAGLAGLSTALFLSWHGVPCLVVERHRNTSPHPRARGIHPYSMELMRTVGLEEAIRQAPSAQALAHNHGLIAAESLAGREFGALREQYFLDSHPDLDTLTPTGWCLCHQDEYEPILLARAREQGAVVRFGTELVSFTDDGIEGVTAVLRDRDSGDTETVRTRFLVAADGPGSPVRSELGIGFEGSPPLGHYLNIHFRADLREALGDRRFIMCYTMNQALRGALMPLDNAERWLLHVTFDPETEPAEGFTTQRCADLVRAAAGLPDLPVEIIGRMPWEAAGRVAESLSAGNVFLVGDAAHVMPPSGAFGSNTGMADAYQLAWKLAAVLAGYAGPELLETHHTERWPVGAATVEQAVLRSRDRPRLTGQEPSAPPNPAIVPDSTVWFGWRLAPGSSEPVWQPDAQGLPGTRAPHVPIERDGIPVSTVDLFGRGFVVLAGAAGGAWLPAAEAAAGTLGAPLAAYRVGPGDLVDLKDTWPTAYGVDPAGAVLVRPDGVVGWRSTGPAPSTPDARTQVLTEALKTVLTHGVA